MATEKDVPTPAFVLPVDTEHKALLIRPWSIALPHMRAFHLSWLGFFTVFISTFAPAALLPVIRQSLNLTKTDIGNAGVASVCGAIGSRVLIGNLLDVYGPRHAMSTVLLFTAPAVFCMGLVQDAAGFIIARFFVGLSLAAFVACQFWTTCMFTTKIVGFANACAASWGNLGGGLTHFIMPYIFQRCADSYPEFQAWRWAFLFPGLLHLIFGVLTLLFSQDLPDGDYQDLKAAGIMVNPKKGGSMLSAVLNYRTWVLTLCYGFSFGIELTVDNVISQYMFDQFELDLHTAGMLGSVFGLMNIFTRASGGLISDITGKYWGMRGRLWSLWVIQTLGGVFCAVLGAVSNSLAVTMVILVLFSIFCQQACGSTYGVTPFISKRGLGQVSGLVGAGGNAGSVITQAIFFRSGNMSTPDAFKWMGVMTVCVTALVLFVYFPMWGGMLCGAKEGVSEEDYYLAEYTADERAQGMHTASLKFAYESKSQRGWVKGAAAQEASVKAAQQNVAHTAV